MKHKLKKKDVLSPICKRLKQIQNNHIYIEPQFKDLTIDLYRGEHKIWTSNISGKTMFKKYMENDYNKLIEVKETSPDSSMSFTVLLNLKTYVYTYDEFPISNIRFILKILC